MSGPNRRPSRPKRSSPPGIAATLNRRFVGVTDGLGTPSTLTCTGSSSTAPETPAGVVTKAISAASSAPIGHSHGTREAYPGGPRTRSLVSRARGSYGIPERIPRRARTQIRRNIGHIAPVEDAARRWDAAGNRPAVSGAGHSPAAMAEAAPEQSPAASGCSVATRTSRTAPRRRWSWRAPPPPPARGRVAQGAAPVGREERSQPRPASPIGAGGHVRALAWSLIRARLSDRSFDNPDLPGRARVNNVYGMLS